MLDSLGRNAGAQLLRLEARFALPQINMPDREQTRAPENIEKRPSVFGADGEISVYLHDGLYGRQDPGTLHC